MEAFYRLLRSGVFIFLICLSPFIYLISTFVLQAFGSNPVEFYLFETGKASLYMFLFVSYINPLSLFPAFKKSCSILMKHKRMIGIACFCYAVLHFVIYILDNSDFTLLMDNLQKPFIQIGSVAFLILIALAVTSNKFSIRKLGSRRWKKLHRLAYLCACLLILHVVAKDKGMYDRAFIYFFPLAMLQLYRFTLYLRRNRAKKLS